MPQIKQIKDRINNQPFYPITHIEAVVGSETKQDTLTPGANVTIDASNVISAQDTTYSAGTNISIDSNNVIKCTLDTYTKTQIDEAEEVIADKLNDLDDVALTKEEQEFVSDVYMVTDQEVFNTLVNL